MPLTLGDVPQILDMVRKTDGRELSSGEKRRAIDFAVERGVLAADAAVELG